MITAEEIEKLRSVRTLDGSVLSLYLPVPLNPSELRGLPALAGGLIDVAEASAGAPARVGAADRAAVRRLVEEAGREWLGHTLAIFASGQLGLLEAVPLACQLTGRCVIATRPHIRPLLEVLQRFPRYLAVIVSRQQAWVFAAAGDVADTIARTQAPAPRVTGAPGWPGPASYRARRRAIERARRHYRDVAMIVRSQMLARGYPPLAVGGHEEGVGELLRLLPERARRSVAGTFAADPVAVTLSRARELADEVIAGWTARRERELIAGVLEAAPRGSGVLGLPACLAAVNAVQVELLLIPGRA
jgi:hypothetical protein